ncbi:adenosylmethionine-8-amino-7-oxononanoate aminotransferase [Anaerobacterium chartisolvens]|uniref:Adenosylmethionine-8-amino-7-oxononanoate aminotransferase n=1 Tax=Anaerobacterium chartisolvens TaxID=1297424 RepID=A0A369AS96_9FIRM|nr:aminotransferase class III-fold pyridoxal phosphate-dependent enzyme [Anaerobacterium chartisolvens]RCX11136.1 adenosylmethionine-8-amino-7-oxononanoate aminotransferase [Anaerobacterium chartisolvens]
MNTSLLRGWTSTSAYEEGCLRFPSVKEAKGIYLYGYDGKRYIDTKSQMMNVSFGHGIQAFRDAVLKQWDQVAYIPTMDGHGNKAAEAFADKLLGLLPGDFKSVYCSGSGTSCCEVAVQVARDYWLGRGREEKKGIISITGGYHGNSAMMSEISEYSEHNRAYRLNNREEYLKVLQPYCYRCPLDLSSHECGEGCAALLTKQVQELDTDKIGAIIFEAVQGNGMIALPRTYMETLSQLAKEHDMLLIADEVLTGFGRTGYDFAFQKYNILPDIICLSKTISNGLLPLGATVFNRKITDMLRDKEIHIGSTQDGNPVCTSLGAAIIDYFAGFEWSLRVRELGEYFLKALKNNLSEYPIVGDIRGTGLLICIELVSDKNEKKPVEDMGPVHDGFIENGLFVFIEANYVYFVPPYTIDESVIDYIISKLKLVLEEYLYRMK